MLNSLWSDLANDRNVLSDLCNGFVYIVLSFIAPDEVAKTFHKHILHTCVVSWPVDYVDIALSINELLEAFFDLESECFFFLINDLLAFDLCN